MTREEFKIQIEKNLALLNEAKRLFPLIFDVLKRYDGKRIGEKTKEKINNELKEKYGCSWRFDDCYLYFVNWNREKIKLLDFVFKKNNTVIDPDGKLNLGIVSDYEIASSYEKFNGINLDELCEEIESNYTKLSNAFNIIKTTQAELKEFLYADLGTFDLRAWCLEELYERYLYQNRLFWR